MLKTFDFLKQNLKDVSINKENLVFENTKTLVAQKFIVNDVHVIKNEGKIIAVGFEINTENDNKKFHNNLKNGFPFFSFSYNKDGRFDFYNSDGVFISITEIEFINQLKVSYPALKTENDLIIEQLNEELEQKSSEIKMLRLTIEDLKESVNSYKLDNEHLNKELKGALLLIEEDVLKSFSKNRFKSKLKKAASTFFNLESKINTSEVYYGRDPSDKYNKTISVENSTVKRFITQYRGDWYLKVECFSYNTELGYELMENTLFAKFNSTENKFEKISFEQGKSILVWVVLSNL
jgi:hypothetical protein